MSMNTPPPDSSELSEEPGEDSSCPPLSQSAHSSPISDVDLDDSSYSLSERVKEKEKQETKETKTMETDTSVSQGQGQNLDHEYIEELNFELEPLYTPIPHTPATLHNNINIRNQVLQTPDTVKKVTAIEEAQTSQDSQPQQLTSSELELETDLDNFDVLCMTSSPRSSCLQEINNYDNYHPIEQDVQEDADNYYVPPVEQSIPCQDTETVAPQYNVLATTSTTTSDSIVPDNEIVIDIDNDDDEKSATPSSESNSVPNSNTAVVPVSSPLDLDNSNHLFFLRDGKNHHRIVKIGTSSNCTIFEKEPALQPQPSSSQAPPVVVQPENLTIRKQPRKRKMPIVEKDAKVKDPRIIGKRGSSLVVVPPPTNDTSFPLPPQVKTVKELGILNRKIKTNNSHRENLINRYCLLGGDHVSLATNAILMQIMHKIKVGGKLNWKGRCGKTGFESYDGIVQVIQESVRKQFPDTKDPKIKGCIIAWLKNAGTSRRAWLKSKKGVL